MLMPANLAQLLRLIRPRWKYTRSFVMDGNFVAEQLNMRRPDGDVVLSTGMGYMTDPAPYKAHLITASETREPTTCNDHRALSQANTERQHLQSTGLGAVACARHGCFVPQSVVDFQKGER